MSEVWAEWFLQVHVEMLADLAATWENGEPGVAVELGRHADGENNRRSHSLQMGGLEDVRRRGFARKPQR